MAALEAYLHASRGRLGSVPESMTDEYYGWTYSALVSLLEPYDLPNAPGLRVVRTPYALTEFVKTDGANWIVYDQFLGQVISRLSALVDQRAELFSIDTYLTKLYADRLLVAGRSEHAHLMALTHSHMRMADSFRGLPNRERLKSVHAQETFVLAHELIHFGLSASADFRSYWYAACFALIETAEEVVDELFGAEDQSGRHLERLADDYNREYVRRYGPQDLEMLSAGRASLIQAWSKKPSDPSVFKVRAVRESAALEEEVVCDAVAAVLTGQLLGGGHLDSVKEIFVSCLQASQHLRLVKVMDAKLAGPSKFDSAVYASTARGHLLRLFFRAVFEANLPPSLFGTPTNKETNGEELDSLLRGLAAVNVEFYEQIFDSVLTGSFYGRFTGDEAEGALALAAKGIPGGLESWVAAADLLGL